MNIEIIGLGHIGVVMLASLSKNNVVIGIDKNTQRIDELSHGKKIFYEEYVFDELSNNLENIKFSNTVDHGYINNDSVSFICVGTPFNQNDNKLSIDALYDLVSDLANRDKNINKLRVYCIRSTIYPGTMKKIIQKYINLGGGEKTKWYYLPEFLREGTAYKDFQNPNISILGRDDSSCDDIINKVLPRADNNIQMSLDDSELIKLIFNSWHAVKISFANEIGYTAKALGLNHNEIINAFISDKKLNISDKYLKPGFSFGGYCLPKDSKAMTQISKSVGFSESVIGAALKINDEILERWFNKIIKKINIFDNILFVGIAFKEGCGDIRESPYFDLCNRLINNGYKIDIYDPHALNENPELINKYTFIRNIAAKKYKIIIKSYDIHEFNYYSIQRLSNRLINLNDLC